MKKRKKYVLKTHGMSSTPMYYRWTAILSRCRWPKNKHYDNYGGRGIRVEWKSFEDFYRDMIPTFKPRLSIDRIDPNGNYCKENCRWATRKEQANNTRQNHLLTYKGETKNVKQWSEHLGIPVERLRSRIRRGWSTEDILKRKPRYRGYSKAIEGHSTRASGAQAT